MSNQPPGGPATPAWPSPKPTPPPTPPPPTAPPRPPTPPPTAPPRPPTPPPSAPPTVATGPGGYAPPPTQPGYGGGPGGPGGPGPYPPGPPSGYNPPPAKRSRKGLVAVALIAVGVLAASSIAFFVVRAVTGNSGGASSPQAAVEDLAAAIDAEDAPAALEVMNPDEVEALSDVYDTAAERAENLGFAPGNKTFGGIDVKTSGLTYRVENVGDDAARVIVTGGKADVDVSRSGLGDTVDEVVSQQARANGEEPPSGDSYEVEPGDLAVGEDEEPSPIIVVRRGGGWYVSPLYTAAQAITQVNDLPAPVFPAPEAGDGAGSPQAAVRALADAIAASNPQQGGNALAGESGALVRSYTQGIEKLVADALSEAEVTDLETTISDLTTRKADYDGDGEKHVITNVEGSVTWQQDGDQQASFTWDGECLAIERGGADMEGEGETSEDCITADTKRLGVSDTFVIVTEENGGWKVDPIETLAAYAGDIVPKITKPVVLRALGYPEVDEPTGRASVGSPATVELNEGGYAVLSLDVQADEGFTVTTSIEGSDRETGAYLVSPDGSYESAFDLVEPSESGTYRLVVFGDGFSPGMARVSVSGVERRDIVLGEPTADEIETAGEIIEFTFPGNSGARLELNLSNPDLEPTIFDPSGDEVTPDDANFFDVDDDGEYRVRVDGGFDRNTGEFRLLVQEAKPFTIGRGTSNLLTGNISDDAGQFTDIKVRANARVMITVQPDTPTLNPSVTIRLEGDTEVFNASGPGRPVEVTFSPTEDTTYRVEVRGASGSRGPYRVTAEEVR